MKCEHYSRQAFPCDRIVDGSGVVCATGLSKREYFAAMALSGELASSTLIWSGDVFSAVAENAYKFADAMIAEGKK